MNKVEIKNRCTLGIKLGGLATGRRELGTMKVVADSFGMLVAGCIFHHLLSKTEKIRCVPIFFYQRVCNLYILVFFLLVNIEFRCLKWFGLVLVVLLVVLMLECDRI